MNKKPAQNSSVKIMQTNVFKQKTYDLQNKSRELAVL